MLQSGLSHHYYALLAVGAAALRPPDAVPGILMLTLAILVPLLAAVAIALLPMTEAAARRAAVATAAVPLLLLAIVWARVRDRPGGAGLPMGRPRCPGSPRIDVAWRVGVDGISLPIAAMSALLFLAAIAWPAETKGRAGHYYAWFLFLEAASLGLFLTLDLLVFYVFFDLSLVGMYFLIGRWGHGDAMAAALKFFIYTLAGSLAILLAILGLALSAEAPTFDMRTLIERQPLAGAGVPALLVLAGFMLGFGIKTPRLPCPHLAAARACRRAGAGLGHPGRRAAEDGHLRNGTDPALDDGRDLRPLRARHRHRRRRLGALGRAGRAMRRGT